MIRATGFGDCLGRPIEELLAEVPFAHWEVIRTAVTDVDPVEIHYEFPGQGLELRCNEGGRVDVVFVFVDKVTDHRFLVVPVGWVRDQVRAFFGDPEKSSNGSHHPVLGEIAAWDRFRTDKGLIRFEYSREGMRVLKVTLMLPGVAP